MKPNGQKITYVSWKEKIFPELSQYTSSSSTSLSLYSKDRLIDDYFEDASNNNAPNYPNPNPSPNANLDLSTTWDKEITQNETARCSGPAVVHSYSQPEMKND